ncbi:MAG: hypothetical protein MJZ93_02545 [Paludibacteraceae bacterium]|nr:hypothetical protein [Paludibacteraceae bacterium]
MKRQLNNYCSTSEYVPWEDATSILVFFESDYLEQNYDIKEMIDSWRREGKKVSTCQYTDKKETEQSSLDNFVVIDQKSVDFWGRTTSIAALRMLEEDEFDIVLDLTMATIRPLVYLLIGVNAKMRCGKKTELMKGIYDFQIEMKMPEFDDSEEGIAAREEYNERKELADQIVRYLKMIKKL